MQNSNHFFASLYAPILKPNIRPFIHYIVTLCEEACSQTHHRPHVCGLPHHHCRIPITAQQFKKRKESMVEIPAASGEDDWCALWFFYHSPPKQVHPHVHFVFCRTCEGQNIKYRTCSNVVSSAKSSLCNGCQSSLVVVFIEINWNSKHWLGIQCGGTVKILPGFMVKGRNLVIYDPVVWEKGASCAEGDVKLLLL